MGRPTQQVVWSLALSMACLLATLPASANAASFSGPRVVVPARVVSFEVSAVPPGADVSVLLQPSRYRGGNCCGVAIRSHSTAGPEGRARLIIRWPTRYARCSGTRNCKRYRWARNMRVDVSACVDDGNAGCFRRVVRVR